MFGPTPGDPARIGVEHDDLRRTHSEVRPRSARSATEVEQGDPGCRTDPGPEGIEERATATDGPRPPPGSDRDGRSRKTGRPGAGAGGLAAGGTRYRHGSNGA